jgi:nicotinamidase-related amidase
MLLGVESMLKVLPHEAVLLIIDVQNAIDMPVWSLHGPRNNLIAEENMATILSLWRQAGRKIIHVKHESTNPDSSYYPGQLGCEFKECVQPLSDELVIVKKVHSAFIGTALEATLRSLDCSHLVVFGVITNNSVEATVRMAGNLGFSTYLVEDATFTFAKPDYSGRLRSAEEVHCMSLANLEPEYCRVISTDELREMI